MASDHYERFYPDWKTPVVQADPTAFGRVVPAYKDIVWHGAQRSEHHAKTMKRVWAVVLVGLRKTVGADLSH